MTFHAIDETGVLCLKWPDIIKDRGMESRAILDGLGSRDLLVIDPMQPFRRVTEVRVGIGAPWKVIRVQPVLREILGITTAPYKKPISEVRPVPAPITAPSDEPTPKHTLVQLAEQNDANAKRLIEKKLKLLDEVVAVLQESVASKSLNALEENGSLLISVSDAESMLKDRFKVSRAQILGLQRLNPQRFSTVERDRIVYFRLSSIP